jgi:hypothetical protein
MVPQIDTPVMGPKRPNPFPIIEIDNGTPFHNNRTVFFNRFWLIPLCPELTMVDNPEKNSVQACKDYQDKSRLIHVEIMAGGRLETVRLISKSTPRLQRVATTSCDQTALPRRQSSFNWFR